VDPDTANARTEPFALDFQGRRAPDDETAAKFTREVPWTDVNSPPM
jgi:hypothetical protein